MSNPRGRGVTLRAHRRRDGKKKYDVTLKATPLTNSGIEPTHPLEERDAEIFILWFHWGSNPGALSAVDCLECTGVQNAGTQPAAGFLGLCLAKK